MMATREDALRQVAAVEKLEHRRISDPSQYFRGQIEAMGIRMESERQLDPEGSEMAKIRGALPTEVYFIWLEEVLAYQRAYLKALS